MALADFAGAVVGVPYVDFGRSSDGYDCWGLVIAGCAVLGVAAPDYAYGDTKLLTAVRAYRRHASTSGFVEMLGRAATDDVPDGAIALMGGPVAPYHAGMMVHVDGEARILHAIRPRVVCETLSAIAARGLVIKSWFVHPDHV